MKIILLGRRAREQMKGQDEAMKISIISRKDAEGLLKTDTFPENTAVISFYSPGKVKAGDYEPVDYGRKPIRHYYACVPDIDIEALSGFGYTYESYFSDVDELAAFICDAVKDGLGIICQCDYGQSRSAACAAAILEHFEKKGISIFADYRYYPNQLVFNKILDALRKLGNPENV